MGPRQKTGGRWRWGDARDPRRHLAADRPEDKCAFAALRDGTGLLQISDLLAEPHAYGLAPVPGPEREVLGTGTLERCTLREAAFFRGCIDAPGDLCATSSSWVTDCVPELTPVCPGA